METMIDELQGKVIRPGDAEYEHARRVWNAAIDRRPALIVRARTAADVSRAVRWAHAEEMPLAVRGGGHSPAGHGVVDGGLVIDLRPMRLLAIDPERRIASAGGGLTWGDYNDGAGRHALATPAGDVAAVGVAGLALGGGFGLLSRKYGMTVDNLLEVDLVTAGGDLLTADAETHPELFWAVRGGGGNFGIAIELRFRLHPVDTVDGRRDRLSGHQPHPAGVHRHGPGRTRRSLDARVRHAGATVRLPAHRAARAPRRLDPRVRHGRRRYRSRSAERVSLARGHRAPRRHDRCDAVHGAHRPHRAGGGQAPARGPIRFLARDLRRDPRDHARVVRSSDLTLRHGHAESAGRRDRACPERRDRVCSPRQDRLPQLAERLGRARRRRPTRWPGWRPSGRRSPRRRMAPTPTTSATRAPSASAPPTRRPRSNDWQRSSAGTTPPTSSSRMRTFSRRRAAPTSHR